MNYRSTLHKKITTTFLLTLFLTQSAPLAVFADTANTSPSISTCGSTASSGGTSAVSVAPGGVKLDKAAVFLANMSDVTGAYYDQQRNVIVFVGTTNTALPQFDKDDLAVAIRSEVFNNTDPAVSIDFKDLSNPLAYPTMKVSYYGGIENTHFGQVLYDADYQLKRYVVGYTEAGAQIQSSAPGYQSVLSRWIAYGPDTSKPDVSRWWISPQTITIKKDDASNSFVFDTVKMQVQYASLNANNDPAWDKAGADFAANQTQYFDQYAIENPAYLKAKELGKIVSVIKWMKDNQIATDFQWAQNYTPTYQATPQEVNRITSPNITSGSHYYAITGGVQYTTPNTYTTNSTSAAASLESASAAAATTSTDGITWAFTQNGQTYSAVAVSADVFRMPGAYTYATTDGTSPSVTSPYVLTRTYTSFNNDTNDGFGYGWSFLPASLTTAGSAMISCSPSSGYSGTYPMRVALATKAGRETFTYQCPTGYVADDPRFHSQLVRNSDGTFTANMKDGTSYSFKSMLVRGVYPLTYSGDTPTTGKIYVYNAAGYLLGVNDKTTGQVIASLTVNPSYQITSAVFPTATMTYSYDTNGDLVAATDARGNSEKYTYTNHLLTTITNRAGTLIVTNAYDALKRVTSTTDARGITRAITYDSSTGTVTTKDQNGRTQKQVFDTLGRLATSTDPLGNTITYNYGTTSDKPIRVTDARGNTMQVSYDAAGNPTTLTYPDGGTISYTWDSVGNLVSINDQRYSNPKTTTYTYDTNRNRTQATVGSATTKYTYTASNKVASATDALGNTTTYTYDTLSGLPLTITDPQGNVTTYTYDASGRVTSVKDASGVVASFTYDSNGNKLTEATPAGSVQYQYDANNRLLKSIDQLGYTKQLSYDTAGNLASVTDQNGAITSYTYDTYGNLAKRTDALGRNTQYAYDALNRQVSAITPGSKTSATTYDANGNVASQTRPDGTSIQSTYDKLNRVTQVTIGTGTSSATLAYTYNSAGRLTKVSGPTGATSYTYDMLDRVTAVTDPYNATVQYQYDALNHLTQITYPDGKTIQYQYDIAGHLTKQTDWNGSATTYTYSPAGLLLTETKPNGIITTRSYDTANRLASSTATLASQTLFSQAITRDARGFVTKLVETGPLPRTVSYTYDASGRLTSAQEIITGSGVTPSNLTTTNTFSLDDELTKSITATGSVTTSTSTTYDLNGNLTTQTGSSTVRDSWNAQGLLGTTTIGSNSTVFTYDAQGNRINKGATRYVNDITASNALVLEEQTTAGTLTRANVWGATGLVSTGGAASATRYYPITDLQGSVRALTDASGNVVQYYSYDPYGATATSSSAVANPYRFDGEAQDETGLLYLRARYYDPATGRFISRDPVSGTQDNPITQNAYPYAADNPVMYADPSGQFVPLLLILGTAAVLYLTDPMMGSACGDINPSAQQFANENNVSLGFLIASLATGDGAELAATRYIKIGSEDLLHVLARHTADGAMNTGKSVFSAGEDIESLIRASNGVEPVVQNGGNLERIVDAGRMIGIDRLTGEATSIYTVITDTLDNLVTAFPGRP